MISISIVDDNPAFRCFLAGYLRTNDQFLVKGAYQDAETAMQGLLADAPDIAIVDIKMAGMCGITLISKVKQFIPRTQYLICTARQDCDSIFKALEAGASGYILKDTSKDAITHALLELYFGGSPLSPFIARKVVARFQNAPKVTEAFDLTAREQEVLHQLTTGMLYKEIAQSMSLSTFTVKNHLKNIYRKLRVQNKVEALNKYNLL